MTSPLYIGQLEPGLHIVVTIPEHASDVASKRILRLLIDRLQTFLEKYECYWMCHYNYVKKKACVKSL